MFVMKRIVSNLVIIVVCASTMLAGTAGVYAKDLTTSSPGSGWYADSEWNVSLWGSYVFTENDYPSPANSFSQDFLVPINSGLFGPQHDTYLDADHAWGGGIDLKYFFRRYFGVGVQGWLLHARRYEILNGTEHESRLIGGVLSTLTLRYPVGSSRLAPYLWAGVGGIFGGGEVDDAALHESPAGVVLTLNHRGTETGLMGQFGGGFEIRLTPHIGLTNDFSWNVIEGSKNNFGMARTGINFAF